MLYIFAGFPQCRLNAGGLAHCVREVEWLGELELEPLIYYCKEGVFAWNQPHPTHPVSYSTWPLAERLGAVEYWLSPALERAGITWDWFPPTYAFGNGITISEATARMQRHEVEYNTGIPVEDLKATGHSMNWSRMTTQVVNKITSSWTEYEKRWKPGTCPKEDHLVTTTRVITRGRLDPWALTRLEKIIEDPSTVLTEPERYEGRHFTESYTWRPGREPSKEAQELLRGMGGNALLV